LYLVTRKKWSKGLAATCLMLASFLVILLPVYLFINIMYAKIDFTIQHSNEVVAGLKMFIAHIETEYHVVLISDKNIENISIAIAQLLPRLLGATFNSLVIVIILYFILYFLLVNSREMEAWLYRNVPLKKENVKQLGEELRKLVFSNALGIPVTAVLQGVIGAVGYYFLGVDDIPFWFVVTCITAMVPMIGSALAYISVAILFFAQGNATKGIMMLIYGALIMNVLDSVFRIGIQKRIGNTHPLVTTFGVIIGINLFGFIGLVFGPILISLFILLIRIYLNEFGEMESTT
ncbi:MAG: AI-2E family transporter, partial [Bacteroidota bacterium]|nr:AI-2E family transporter [Bacteroidota bacterium]